MYDKDLPKDLIKFKEKLNKIKEKMLTSVKYIRQKAKHEERKRLLIHLNQYLDDISDIVEEKVTEQESKELKKLYSDLIKKVTEKDKE